MPKIAKVKTTFNRLQNIIFNNKTNCVIPKVSNQKLAHLTLLNIGYKLGRGTKVMDKRAAAQIFWFYLLMIHDTSYSYIKVCAYLLIICTHIGNISLGLILLLG